jgi:upstream activation factor subunit UAF30
MAGMAKETKTAAKSDAKPKAAAAKTERKVNPALMKPMTPSKELGAVVGTKPLPRTEVVSKVWEYIKSNKLQNPKNGREILADDKLKKVFGTDKVTMFEMNKHLSKHLS